MITAYMGSTQFVSVNLFLTFFPISCCESSLQLEFKESCVFFCQKKKRKHNLLIAWVSLNQSPKIKEEVRIPWKRLFATPSLVGMGETKTKGSISSIETHDFNILYPTFYNTLPCYSDLPLCFMQYSLLFIWAILQRC